MIHVIQTMVVLIVEAFVSSLKFVVVVVYQHVLMGRSALTQIQLMGAPHFGTVLEFVHLHLLPSIVVVAVYHYAPRATSV
jgi:hypothetical protein